MKKILVLMLAVFMLLVAAACGSTEVEEVVVDEYRTYDAETYSDECSTIYSSVLGEFYEAYQTALAQTNVSYRYAYEAIAEAKLMEAGIMLPTTTTGGTYAIGRVAPYTQSFALWGADSGRYDQILVTEEIITASDRTVMKAKWLELSGTGTYYAWALNYLEEQGYTLKDSYTYYYSSEGVTWDILNTSRSADALFITNTIDALVRYDVEGTLCGSLATSWEVSEDGLTYTFYLREGVEWVDVQGRSTGYYVTADDFVAAFQHMLDCGDNGGLNALVEGIIVGVTEYDTGAITTMDSVGVIAVDDYTLQYVLEEPCSYFLSMLTYNWAYPMCRAYYESLGGTFGADYATSGAGTYGTSSSTILYCGAFLPTSQVSGNSFVYTANPKYWNAENQTIKTYTLLYNDGTDVTKTYYQVIAGEIDYAVLNTSTMVIAEANGDFDNDLVYVTNTGSTSYMAFWNLNRLAYANTNDGSVVSPQTANEANRTHNALLNQNFRLALCCAWDRVTWNAQSVGDELASNSIRNSYTPWNFVSLTEDVTITYNGVEVTFEAGTWFGAIEQYVLDADGYSNIVVYDETQENVGDGYDGWYNVEAAQAYLAAAVEELAAEGFTIDEENPIYIDLPYFSGSETYSNKANAMKQSIEEALGGLVIINLVACETASEWYYCGYYTSYGYEANYDVYDLSGWGPDYGDPSTYLDTFLPDGAGYMAKLCGLW